MVLACQTRDFVNLECDKTKETLSYAHMMHMMQHGKNEKSCNRAMHVKYAQ